MNKVHLIIMDGVGLGKHDKGDAFFHTKKPFLDKLIKNEPYSKLKTDGECVGLPSFQTGGSEVGHITIGSGRIVKHLLTIINDQIESKKFFENPILEELFKKAKTIGRIHFMGLVSDGGIHSFLPHLFGLQKMAKKYGISNVFIHALLDGRDVGERSAREYLKQIENQKTGKIATIGGRFFAMDRDTNWERTQEAYEVITKSKINAVSQTWQEVLDNFYQTSKKSDYYISPTLLEKKGQITSEDIVINFNYRIDRMRQISRALCDNEFDEFRRSVQIKAENYGVFGDYNPQAQKVFALKKEKGIPHTLGEIVANNKGKQLRISETEKFNHVTFYFSGQRKEEFKNEKRILVPSKKCDSYAKKPAMSAKEQTKILIEELEKNDYNLIVQNFANGDLVGHSGNIEASIKAIQILDKCLKELIPNALKKGYDVILTADHGNCDEMIYPNGEVSAAHSKNLVPCWVISDQKLNLKENGTLADIAPTILNLLDINIPSEMTGESLIKK